MGAAKPQGRASGAPGPWHKPPEAPELKRRVTSPELFAGAREVIIEHHGEEYRLRITKQGKLILTK
jgi:hemin uptake protein HemP